MSLERKRILEFVKGLEMEKEVKAPQSAEERNLMPQDMNASLMDVLGLLSEATSRLAQLLRGGAPLTVASRPAPIQFVQDEEATPIPPPSSASALDRIQEYEPGPAAAEEQETPKKRGRRGKLNVSEADLRKMYVTEGMTAKEIGMKFGVAPGTVAQRVMKLGLSKRGPSPMKGKTKSKK